MKASSVFLLSLVLSLCAVASAQTYKITDLGALPGGTSSGAHAINSTGQVTGYSFGSSSASNIFLYSNSAMTSAGTLGGTTGLGNAINASGQIAGYATDSTGTYRAVVSNGNTLTNIGDLGGNTATAYGSTISAKLSARQARPMAKRTRSFTATDR